jgi:hypothetical protein
MTSFRAFLRLPTQFRVGNHKLCRERAQLDPPGDERRGHFDGPDEGGSIRFTFGKAAVNALALTRKRPATPPVVAQRLPIDA